MSVPTVSLNDGNEVLLPFSHHSFLKVSLFSSLERTMLDTSHRFWHRFEIQMEGRSPFLSRPADLEK